MYSVGKKKDCRLIRVFGAGAGARENCFCPPKSTSQTSERAKSFGRGRKYRRRHANSIFSRGAKQRKFGTKGILDLFFSEKNPTLARTSKTGIHKKALDGRPKAIFVPCAY
jgi:hypothetical protein